jgi:hypothetical protein
MPGTKACQELTLAQDDQRAIPKASALPLQKLNFTITELQLLLPPAVISKATPLVKATAQETSEDGYPDLQAHAIAINA